jgi:uncharacterized protein (TIGR02145 family)
MAEAKNSFIKSKMNKDLDERLIPSSEYRDAFNIAVSRSENSDVGALESVRGNSQTSRSSQNGNFIIGTYVDETNSIVYYFRTNHTAEVKAPFNALCTIGAYNAITNVDVTLVSGSFLNFSTTEYMNGISLIENQLFFSDNRNQPRKIKVDAIPGTHYFNEDQISVAKFSPYKAPEFTNLRANPQDFANYTDSLEPSTMSDAQDPVIVEVGIYDLSIENLAVKSYRNGEIIPEAQTRIEWDAADVAQEGRWCYYNNSLGNGVTYGILYNKWAVLDSRQLAPIGFRIPLAAEWANIISSGPSTSGQNWRSIDLWDETFAGYQEGNNLVGTNIKPAGYRRTAGTGGDGFTSLTTAGRFWASDSATDSYVQWNPTAVITQGSDGNTSDGYSVRVLRDAGYNGWNGDPDFLSDKFARFSYRFKFEDNEYSTVAPFSQDVFMPYQEGRFVNDDENNAFVTTVVEWMQNSINNAVLNITLPCNDIINNYKITEIDILFTESDSLAFKVVETIRVNEVFVESLNGTNIYQYSYQSRLPVTTLPEAQNIRVFDKVPVRALAQETSGNRIMYGNYLSTHSAPDSLSYYVGSKEKSTQQFIEYPQHSAKQNRNYQVGIVLADKYGRHTDVVLSSQDGLLDADGNPQPGSNYFSDYKKGNFGSKVADWRGDNLALFYLQQIPEGDIGISGYPGAYADGNYYTVDSRTPDSPSSLYPFFLSLGTQCIVSTLDQTVFDTSVLFLDATGLDNTFNVFKNFGNGWVLQEESSYTPSPYNTYSDDYTRITFNDGVALDVVVKVEVLYTSSNRYKYTTGAGTGDAVRSLFPNFATTYQNYFFSGQKLRGLYIDYTQMYDITAVLDNNNDAKAVVFYTDEEVATDYLFDNTPNPVTTEPTKQAREDTYATYTINPLGFYMYKPVVKQQQQDYYNVYLPGIVNGYPIVDEVKEKGETAFVTLVTDNVNKVPRSLTEVGPTQNQFTSDVSMFGRVTNITEVSDTTGFISTYNVQYDPVPSADKVDLIANLSSAFPDLQPANPLAPSAGDVNSFSVYNYNTNPVLAKISTRNAIGIKETLYDLPVDGEGNYPYPENMGLAIYETSPFVSNLDLFYETSTADLISDLNLSVVNTSTDVTALTTFESNFQESANLGVPITTDFFPIAGGNPLTNTSLQSFEVYHYDSTTQTLDTINPVTSQFLVSSGASPGSYRVLTNDTFYAGSSQEPAYNVTWRGRYQFVLNIEQEDATVVAQSFEIQLENSVPTVLNPNPPLQNFDLPTAANASIVTTQGNGTIVSQSPQGRNGSAKTTPPGQTTFSSASGWTIYEASRTRQSTGTTETITSGFDSWYQTASGSTDRPPFQTTVNEYQTFVLSGKADSNGNYPGEGNLNGYSYTVRMRLTDTLGAVNEESTLTYTIGPITDYTGTVQWIPYVKNDITNGAGDWNTSDAFANWKTSMPYTRLNQQSTPFDTQVLGQFTNWTDQPVYIYSGGSIQSVTPPSTQIITLPFNFPTPGGTAEQFGPTFMDYTRVFTDALNNQYNADIGGSNYTTSTTNPIGPFNPNYCVVPGGTADLEGVRVIAILQPFTQASGGASSTMAELTAAGVRPGMKNTSGGTLGNYDFTGCAVVNFGAVLNRTPSTAVVAGTLGWSYENQNCSNPNSPNATNGTTYTSLTPGAGFYINETDGDVDTYPTNVKFSTQNIGPTEPI